MWRPGIERGEGAVRGAQEAVNQLLAHVLLSPASLLISLPLWQRPSSGLLRATIGWSLRIGDFPMVTAWPLLIAPPISA